MPAASLPENENERLAALLTLQIVGTARTTEFDIFPLLASKVFSVPVSAISLVDEDRQWFKASVGLDVTETPRTHSFCAHAILDPSSTLCVPDATKDPRFADNPLVTGDFGLRFYAGSPIFGPDGHAVGAICIIDRTPRDANEEMLTQLRLLATGVSSALKLHASVQEERRLALTDTLTGLVNRAGLDQRLGHWIEQHSTRSVDDFGFLLLDLDDFKSINDLFGHDGGDTVLREVALRLSCIFPESDVLCRFGGDKFGVLVRNVPDRDALRDKAERVHAAFVEPFTVRHQPVPVRTSIGVAVSTADVSTPESLIRKADVALYEAKRSGRGMTCFAASKARSTSAPIGREGMEERLREALVPAGHEPFSVMFQPIFKGRDGRLAGFEALVRWPDTNGRMISPAEFIPVAEATGLVVQLDRWVLNQACQLAAGWPNHLKISSNLSAANFFAVGLVREVERTLRRHDLAPDRLKLEITETVLLRDPARVRATISDLRRLGAEVILDDFGAGHASLAYLRDYAFSGLKIDRSFTAELETNPRSQVFVRAIIDMTNALEMKVTAEGVETPGQLDLLCNSNVDLVQGFLLGRPMMPEAVTNLVREQQDLQHLRLFSTMVHGSAG